MYHFHGNIFNCQIIDNLNGEDLSFGGRPKRGTRHAQPETYCLNVTAGYCTKAMAASLPWTASAF